MASEERRYTSRNMTRRSHANQKRSTGSRTRGLCPVFTRRVSASPVNLDGVHMKNIVPKMHSDTNTAVERLYISTSPERKLSCALGHQNTVLSLAEPLRITNPFLSPTTSP